MKLDLSELEERCELSMHPYMHDAELLTLIRVVRAAKALIHCYEWPRKSELRMDLAAALFDIEDSAS